MKIAMFGGTFDPVHRGHTDLAAFILERRHADRVLFIPAPVPPHKTEQTVSPYEIRRRMLELALSGMAGVGISDIECERTGRSYSIDTLTQLKARYPADQILLLIGADSLAALHTWYQAEQIAADFTVLTYPRPGCTVTAEHLRSHWSEADAEKLLSGILQDAPVFPCSSTEIRAGAGREMLHPAVLDLIRKQKLYQK